jgi:mRNA interferase YafQ
MPSTKKPASSRRTALPLVFNYAKSFLKDWERLTAAGRFDMIRLKYVMLLLIANDGPLGPEWQDHGLKGNWADHRECHVGGDFLLVYRLDQGTVSSSASALMPSSFASRQAQITHSTPARSIFSVKQLLVAERMCT